jgi:SAM-dependent methyltransferase
MSLGSTHAVSAPSAFLAFYRRRFGIEDFHTHIRWHAIKDWIDPTARLTLDVGCNTGVVTLAVAQLVTGNVVASEFNDRNVAEAQKVLRFTGIANVSLSQADMRELGEARRFDQALLIDVLEHIDDDELALHELAKAVLAGGRLIVSVPTPRYPVVFGRRFHEAIGHVRDGYSMATLGPKLRDAGFDVIEHRYYTGKVASLGAVIAYRWGGPWRAKWLFLTVLRPVALLGERKVKEESAASLAVLAVRRP